MGSDNPRMRHRGEFLVKDDTGPASGVVGSNGVPRGGQGAQGFRNFQIPFSRWKCCSSVLLRPNMMPFSVAQARSRSSVA